MKRERGRQRASPQAREAGGAWDAAAPRRACGEDRERAPTSLPRTAVSETGPAEGSVPFASCWWPR